MATKDSARSFEGFAEVSRGHIRFGGKPDRRAEHVAGGEAQGFVVVGMQQLSLFDENLPSSPTGEARRDDGKAHQAAAASERTKPMVVDLMDQVVSQREPDPGAETGPCEQGQSGYRRYDR